MQMRDRHNECIRMLKDKVSDSREEEQEERRRQNLQNACLITVRFT